MKSSPEDHGEGAGADKAKPQPGAAQRHQPPPSTQPNSSARPSGDSSGDAGAGLQELDSATAAQRAMKQTSKTEPETGSER